MKYFLLTIAVFITLVTFSSCAKDTTGVIVNQDTVVLKDTIILHDTPSSTPYYVTATFNGVNTTYKGYTKALQTYNYLGIYGANNSSSSSDGISIELRYEPYSTVYHNIILPAATYTDTSGGLTNPTHEDLYYGEFYLQQDGIQYEDMPFLGGGSMLEFTCNVTSITDSTISGTFSGTAYYSNNVTNHITITNGSFYVPF
jgi:hypothetical protein